MTRFDYFEHLDGPQSRIEAGGRRILAKGGGGGGGSGTPYYANQDALFGTQAEISQQLYNQYAALAPTYLENTQGMVDDAMDGTLQTRARNQAGADAQSAFGQSMDAVNRNTAKYGAEFNANRMQAMSNTAALGGAANKVNAMNKAGQWAEDQKWNRNAGAYGQIAGMSTGAMQGMSSAGAGFGNMAAQQNANAMANAQGWGKFGASMAGGAMGGYGWVDGGEVDRGNLPALKFASGAYVRKPFQNKLGPVDWRANASSQQSSGSSVLGNAVSAIAPAAMILAARDIAGDFKKGKDGKPAGDSVIMGGLRDATKWAKGKLSDSPSNGVPEIDAGASVDPDAYKAGYDMAERNGYADPIPEQPVMQETGGTFLDPGYDAYNPNPLDAYAKGGEVKCGQRFAGGGFAQPIDAVGGGDPDRFRGQRPSAMDQFGMRLGANAMGAAANPMTYLGAYKKYNAEVARLEKGKSLVGSKPETPGVAEASPVEAPAQVQETALPEAQDANAVSVNVEPPQPYGSTTPEQAQAEFSKAFNGEAPETVATVADGAESVEKGADAAGAAADTAGAATDTAGAAADATQAAGAADAASKAADGAGSVPYLSIAKGVMDIANGRDAGEAVADAAMGYAGAETGAMIGSAVGPVGTVVGGVLGGVLGGSLFAEGGDVEREDFKPGGEVSGPGTETSDDIPAWLSDGEVVHNAEAVRLAGKDALLAINDAGLAVREGRANPEEAKGAIADAMAARANELRAESEAGKEGVKLAGGGFLGGNMGVALGAGVEQFDRQQLLNQRQQQIDIQQQNAERMQKMADAQLAELNRATEERKTLDEAKRAAGDLGSSALAIKDAFAALPGRVKAGELTQDEADNAKKAYEQAGYTPEALADKAGSKLSAANPELGAKYGDALRSEIYQREFNEMVNSGADYKDRLRQLGKFNPSQAMNIEGNMIRSDERAESRQAIASLQHQARMQEIALRAALSGRGGGSGSGSGSGAGSRSGGGAADGDAPIWSRKDFNAISKIEEGPVADHAYALYHSIMSNMSPDQYAGRVAAEGANNAAMTMARRIASGDKGVKVGVAFNPQTLGYDYGAEDEYGRKYHLGRGIDPTKNLNGGKSPFVTSEEYAKTTSAALGALKTNSPQTYSQAEQMAESPRFREIFLRAQDNPEMVTPEQWRILNAASYIRQGFGKPVAAPEKPKADTKPTQLGVMASSFGEQGKMLGDAAGDVFSRAFNGLVSMHPDYMGDKK